MDTMLWTVKNSTDDIINHLNSCMEMLSKTYHVDELKPDWSAVRLKSEEELKRLSNYKFNLDNIFYKNEGSVLFIGYTEDKKERWYNHRLREIIEINSPEIESRYKTA